MVDDVWSLYMPLVLGLLGPAVAIFACVLAVDWLRAGADVIRDSRVED